MYDQTQWLEHLKALNLQNNGPETVDQSKNMTPKIEVAQQNASSIELDTSTNKWLEYLTSLELNTLDLVKHTAIHGPDKITQESRLVQELEEKFKRQNQNNLGYLPIEMAVTMNNGNTNFPNKIQQSTSSSIEAKAASNFNSSQVLSDQTDSIQNANNSGKKDPSTDTWNRSYMAEILINHQAEKMIEMTLSFKNAIWDNLKTMDIEYLKNCLEKIEQQKCSEYPEYNLLNFPEFMDPSDERNYIKKMLVENYKNQFILYTKLYLATTKDRLTQPTNKPNNKKEIRAEATESRMRSNIKYIDDSNPSTVNVVSHHNTSTGTTKSTNNTGSTFICRHIQSQSMKPPEGWVSKTKICKSAPKIHVDKQDNQSSKNSSSKSKDTLETTTSTSGTSTTSISVSDSKSSRTHPAMLPNNFKSKFTSSIEIIHETSEADFHQMKHDIAEQKQSTAKTSKRLRTFIRDEHHSMPILPSFQSEKQVNFTDLDDDFLEKVTNAVNENCFNRKPGKRTPISKELLAQKVRELYTTSSDENKGPVNPSKLLGINVEINPHKFKKIHDGKEFKKFVKRASFETTCSVSSKQTRKTHRSCVSVASFKTQYTRRKQPTGKTSKIRLKSTSETQDTSFRYHCPLNFLIQDKNLPTSIEHSLKKLYEDKMVEGFKNAEYNKKPSRKSMNLDSDT